MKKSKWGVFALTGIFVLATTVSTSMAAVTSKITVKPKTIGVLDIVRSSPIEQVTELAINDAAKKLGWKVIAVDAKGDPQVSAKTIQSFVNQHVDAIITLTVEAAAIRGGLTEAKKAGILTCQATGQTDPSPLWTAQYEENEATLAKTLAEYIIKTNPKAKVADLRQSLNLVGHSRESSMKAVFAPGMNVVATTEPSLGDPGSAQKAVADVLNAHPEIDTVYATMDAWGGPANAAIKAARSKAKVYSFYSSPSNVANLTSDTPYEAVVDTNIQKTALVCMDQFLQVFQLGKKMDPQALVKAGGMIYNIVNRSNVASLVKPGTSGQFTNANELAPFYAKWQKEFGK